jgi:cell fate regulator YaaT (PSP1 superfamily)
MALLVAVKFSQEEMPVLYDPGSLEEVKPQDFVVVPRGESEDVGFVACLEHKSSEQLKLRKQPFVRATRRATPEEVEGWWRRKALEREAMILCKDKARDLRLDIKISHVRYDMHEEKAIFHFTSDQRVDFRSLVRDLGSALKVRIELWQIGVRDEARFIDGFGVCGLQTCCSTWLKDFRPVTIKMAKDQDINLPPVKLSGQCGRLLCCLSYEVDQYRQMGREALPKGATVEWEGKQLLIVDRNLVAKTYLVSDGQGGLKSMKAEDLTGATAKVPDQMKRVGKQLSVEMPKERPAGGGSRGERPAPPVVADRAPSSVEVPKVEEVTSLRINPELEPEEVDGGEEGAADPGRKRSRRGRRGGRGRGGDRGDKVDRGTEAASAGDAEQSSPEHAQTEPPVGENSPTEAKRNFRPKKRKR